MRNPAEAGFFDGKNMKTIGVIGGFGPEATAKFYLEVIKQCRRSGLAHQPHIIVWNVPVPQRLEDEILLHGSGTEKIKPLLLEAARQLEKAGAELLVLPCNTLHVLTDVIRGAINIPFMSIIDITLDKLVKKRVQRVGLLGTSVTIQSDLFRKHQRLIIEALPTQLQKNLNMSLHTFITTHDSTALRQTLKAATYHFRAAGVHDVVVACTDFHGLCPTLKSVTVHDTLINLAKAAVNQGRVSML